MTVYQYKTVAAPRRLKKVKGVKDKDALTAHAICEAIATEAAQGWEYQRADRFQVEEKSGFFSKPVLRESTVLIFRKPVQTAAPVQRHPAPAQPQPAPQPIQRQEVAAEPVAPPLPAPAPASPSTGPGFSIAGVEPTKTPRIGGAND